MAIYLNEMKLPNYFSADDYNEADYSTPTGMRIGADPLGAYGVIDEVRIWNRVLSQSEIQQEMNRGS